MRTNIPSFRLPATVIDEEIAMITGMGVDLKLNIPSKPAQLLTNGGFDAVLSARARPRARS